MGGVVRRYIDILTIIINFPYSTCMNTFLAAASLLCSFKKCCVLCLDNRANVTQRTFGIVQKSRDPATIP